jgi:hypothetical protein
MKRMKSALTALAAIIGIGGSIAATTGAGPYYYTLTTGDGAYELNSTYSSDNCIPGSKYFCEITTNVIASEPTPTQAQLIAIGGTGYGGDELYGY